MDESPRSRFFLNVLIVNRRQSTFLAMLTLFLAASGCGLYPTPIRSARDIEKTSPSDVMIVLVNLPLADWPKLQRFAGLEHFFIGDELAAEVTDDHVIALSRLKFPKLRDVSFANCRRVTDKGIGSLTNIPSIESLQLI